MPDKQFVLEWTASLLGLVYLFLIAKKNKWAWSFGGISSFIYVFVFFKSNLQAQAFLAIAYVFMSIYAFWSWNREDKITLISWRLGHHLLAIQLIFLFGGAVIWMKQSDFSTFHEKETFVLDLFIALFSVFATALGILKEKSNWMYWIFINLACVVLYLQANLYATTILYASYFILGIYGLREWNKKTEAI
jgi:nicotinamide mononucleotide transporter